MPINIYAPISGTGYGVASLNLLKAFDQIGTEPALFSIGGIDASSFADEIPLLQRCLQRAVRFDPDAPSLKVWHQFPTGGQYTQHGMADSIGRGKRLGFFFSELDRLKAVETWHINSLDCVIQPSTWAASVAASSGVKVPQVVVPCAVDTDIFWHDQFPAGNVTNFIAAGKWEYRKGHDVVLQAFLRAFTSEDKVQLTMLCENPFLSPEQTSQWHNYYKNHPMGPMVELLPRQQTQRDVARVFRNAHCGIFPARAEGYNLEAAELLAMGRHVIMTDYSGHTEYGAAAGATMIPIERLEPASDGVWFNADDPSWEGKPGHWAIIGEAQIAAFASSMRQVHQRRLDGTLELNRDGINYFTSWNWAKAAKRIMDHAA